MRGDEISENIGKTVTVNMFIYMDECKRKFIGKPCKLVKQCKNGLLQLSYEDKLFSVAAKHVDKLE